MNRRDILKCFGIGASVVPLLNGTPTSAADSKSAKGCDGIRATAVFKDLNGNPEDQTTVSLELMDPDGKITTPTVIRTGVGVYHSDFISRPGVWTHRWIGDYTMQCGIWTVVSVES